MGTIRFLVTNRVELNGALLNGTGGGAPARDEVSPYLMENAMQPDRRVLWQQSSGNVMQVDIDLGANRSIAYGGIHGHRPLGPTGLGISTCVLQYQTAAAGYNPGGSWNNVSTLTPFSERDSGDVLDGGTVSGRYWRYDMTGVFDAFTIGRLWLGAIDVDLGVLPRFQVERSRRPNVVDRSAGEDPIVTIVGDIRSRFTLQFRNITGTTLSLLKNMTIQAKPVIMLDGDDVPREVILEDQELEHTLTWIAGATKIYDVDVHLEQLG